MIDAGIFEIQYDEERKQYFVTEKLEGKNEYCDYLSDVMDFIEANTWEPSEDAE